MPVFIAFSWLLSCCTLLPIGPLVLLGAHWTPRTEGTVVRGKITKRTVDALIAKAIATGKDQFLWGTELTGFAFKAAPAGKGVYLLAY
jgi:hypothetical protein